MACLMTVSCSDQTAQAVDESQVVARFGDRVIFAEDLRAEADRNPGLDKAELLKGLLTRQSMLLRAEQLKLSDDPEVRRSIERLLVSRLRAYELDEKMKQAAVTEEEIRHAYRQRIDKYTKPAFDRFAMLFLRLERNVTDEKKMAVRERMDEALRKVKAKELKDGFGQLSVTCSDDQMSRYRGGDIGWIASNKLSSRLPESVLETARGLNKGEMTDVVSTDDGFYLVMKTDSRPGWVAEYDAVRHSLRRSLLAEKRQMFEEEYVQQCMNAAEPQIYRDVLAEIDLNPEPEKTEPAFAGKLPANP